MYRTCCSLLLIHFVFANSLLSDEPRRPLYGLWDNPARNEVWVDWKPDLEPLRAGIQSLVDRFYDGCVVKNEDGKIVFSHRTRVFTIHRPYLDGGWQDAKEEVGPNPKGIHCVIMPRKGNTRTGTVVPQKLDYHYYAEYLMAPYSKNLDGSLQVSLRYPSDVDPAFLAEFETLLNRFDRFVRDTDRSH